MSSSSSAVEPWVGPLLRESLAVLRREQPEAHARLCEILQGMAIAIEVGLERFSVSAGPAQVDVRPVEGGEQVRIATRPEVLVDVLNDRRSLTQSVMRDEVAVAGRLDDLLRAHEGLLVYVRGAVRSPGFAPLLKRLFAATPE